MSNKVYRIFPKEFVSGDFIKDYYYYSKKEAISLYLATFPQFKRSQLIIE
jgi:hypothetical protein